MAIVQFLLLLVALCQTSLLDFPRPEDELNRSARVSAALHFGEIIGRHLSLQCVAMSANTESAGRPNILYILADDLGWRDLSCYGSSFYETPNLDRLAARGMKFTDAYAACPVCSPTRASILTGKYPAHVGVTDWINWGGTLHPCKGKLIDAPYTDHIPDSEVTLPQLLRDGGYQTWHVGKWHCGGEGSLPHQRGFEKNIGGTAWGSPGGKGYFSPWGVPGLEDIDVPEGTYLDDWLTDRAVELIENRDPSQPFFLNVWYYLVHTPTQAPEHLVKKYAEKAKRLQLDQIDPLVVGEVFPAEHKYKLRVTRRMVQSNPVYAAMVELMDTLIGRILKAIDDADETDNTLVMFTSDNGGLSTAEGSPTCNHPLSEGKGWTYDGGIRECFIAAWPGVIAENTTCDEPVTSPDFYPTLLEAAEVEADPNHEIDGLSIMPLLKGEARTLDREAIYWHYPHYGNQGGTPSGAVRARDWKLTEFFEDGRVELYNLQDDISETRDLSKDQPQRTEKMLTMLRDWRETVCARMPETNPNYTPPADPESHPAV